MVVAIGTTPIFAQTTLGPNEWTWAWQMGPVYAQWYQGQFSQYSFPDGVPGSTPTWTDTGGHFWMFDGYTVWQFDPSILEWAWMGPSRLTICTNDCPSTGTWGTLGVPDADNWPSSRSGSVGWGDASGNLWLFGGYGTDSTNYFTGSLNDLWKYTPSNGDFTWESGSELLDFSEEAGVYASPGVYGTLGVAAAANSPGARQPAATWTDTSGRLWLFGGFGFDYAADLGNLDDMWMFDPAVGKWTWEAGNDIVQLNDQPAPVYGTLGVPAAGNSPGFRTSAATWTDNNDHLWLFGGTGVVLAASSTPGYGGYLPIDYNDLWEFDPKTTQWLWWGGAGQTIAYDSTGLSVVTTLSPPAYGTLGVPANGNLPGPRYQSVTWTDNAGNFWLFGGQGYDAAGVSGSLNDLWEFNPGTRQWAWISGSSTLPPCSYTYCGSAPSVLGTLGVAAPTNVPGGTAMNDGWSDLDGNLWLFAGTSNPIAANLLVFHPATATMPKTATPALSVGGASYSTAQSVGLSDTTSGSTIYYTLDGTQPTPDSAVYDGPIEITENTTLQAMAAAPDHYNSVVVSATYTIAPGFGMTASPVSLTATGGASATTTVSVTATGGFDSAVSFACSGLPAGATCSFAPATVTPPGTTSTTLTVTTASSTAGLRRHGKPEWPEAAVAIALCWSGWKRRRRWPMLVLLAASLIGTAAVNGCGAGSNGGPGGGANGGGGGTPPVTSTVTVTATSGTLQQITTFTLTVD